MPSFLFLSTGSLYYDWVNDATLGVLLKCFAPLSVGCVQTPILKYATVWLTIFVCLCCMIPSVIWTTSLQ